MSFALATDVSTVILLIYFLTSTIRAYRCITPALPDEVIETFLFGIEPVGEIFARLESGDNCFVGLHNNNLFLKMSLQIYNNY